MKSILKSILVVIIILFTNNITNAQKVNWEHFTRDGVSGYKAFVKYQNGENELNTKIKLYKTDKFFQFIYYSGGARVPLKFNGFVKVKITN